MKSRKAFPRMFLPILVAVVSSGPAPARSMPVYGEDSRREVYKSDPALRRLANSTVSLVNKIQLIEYPSNHSFGVISNPHIDVPSNYVYGSNSDSNSADIPLAPSQRFYGQPIAAYCSGALIAPDVVLTAGHCLDAATSRTSCEDIVLLFGFSADRSAQPRLQFPKNDVYHCRRELHVFKKGDGSGGTGSFGEDWGLVLLDRPVSGHAPLAVNSAGPILQGTEVFTIGHPLGMPTKITGKAPVTKVWPTAFEANLDVFHGNSGGPAFNAQTFAIEGVIDTESYKDFYLKKDGTAGVAALAADDPNGSIIQRAFVPLAHLRELREGGSPRVAARQAAPRPPVVMPSASSSEAFRSLSKAAALGRF